MLTAALWLIGTAWLVTALAVLIEVVSHRRQTQQESARVRELEQTALEATLTICALTVECDRLQRQQFSGPLTVCYRGQAKTIRIRPVARAVPFFLPGN